MIRRHDHDHVHDHDLLRLWRDCDGARALGGAYTGGRGSPPAGPGSLGILPCAGNPDPRCTPRQSPTNRQPRTPQSPRAPWSPCLLQPPRCDFPDRLQPRSCYPRPAGQRRARPASSDRHTAARNQCQASRCQAARPATQGWPAARTYVGDSEPNSWDGHCATIRPLATTTLCSYRG